MIGCAILSDTARERSLMSSGRPDGHTGGKVLTFLADQYVIDAIAEGGGDRISKETAQWQTASKLASAPVRPKAVVS